MIRCDAENNLPRLAASTASSAAGNEQVTLCLAYLCIHFCQHEAKSDWHVKIQIFTPRQRHGIGNVGSSVATT